MTPPHVILAPRHLDFSFGTDVHERYPCDIPQEKLDAMSPLKRKFASQGAAKAVTLTVDQREGRKWRPLPPLFMAEGLMVSQEFRDILIQFNLGEAQLLPVDLTAPKNADQGQAYYVLTLKQPVPKHPVILDESRGLAPQQDGVRQHFLELDLQPDDLAIAAAPESDIDLWSDPQLFSVYLTSGPLSQALIDAGLATALHMVPCRLI